MSKKIKVFLKALKLSPDTISPDRNNPMDPWASKYESVEHIDETWKKDPLLSKYLKSQGLDPRYVDRNKMISHSKSGDFDRWKQDRYSSAMLTHGMAESGSKSKAAMIIREIYKRLRTEDSDEKNNKPDSSYGKSPKFDQTKEKDSLGDNKAKARAILSGGTTLTGEKRDVVEFDPELRARASSSDKIKVDKNGKTKDSDSTK